MIMHLRAAVQELYAAGLGDFMAVRKSLVAQAKASGDAELAGSVAKLRKPTVAAWAVNHFTRLHPERLDELTAFAELLREAQRTLDGEQLRTLGRERSNRVDATAEQVEAAAVEAGQPVGASVAAELRETLTAFVADEEAERAVRTGALVKALSYAGFGSVDLTDVAALPPEDHPELEGTEAESPHRPTATSGAPSDSDGADAPPAAIDLAERREAKRERERRRLTAALETAERARAKAEHQLDVARARQAEAQAGIADLERRLAAARARLDKATDELAELSGIRDDRARREAAARDALTEHDAQ